MVVGDGDGDTWESACSTPLSLPRLSLGVWVRLSLQRGRQVRSKAWRGQDGRLGKFEVSWRRHQRAERPEDGSPEVSRARGVVEAAGAAGGSPKSARKSNLSAEDAVNASAPENRAVRNPPFDLNDSSRGQFWVLPELET